MKYFKSQLRVSWKAELQNTRICTNEIYVFAIGVLLKHRWESVTIDICVHWIMCNKNEINVEYSSARFARYILHTVVILMLASLYFLPQCVSSTNLKPWD